MLGSLGTSSIIIPPCLYPTRPPGWAWEALPIAGSIGTRGLAWPGESGGGAHKTFFVETGSLCCWSQTPGLVMVPMGRGLALQNMRPPARLWAHQRQNAAPHRDVFSCHSDGAASIHGGPFDPQARPTAFWESPLGGALGASGRSPANRTQLPVSVLARSPPGSPDAVLPGPVWSQAWPRGTEAGDWALSCARPGDRLWASWLCPSSVGRSEPALVLSLRLLPFPPPLPSPPLPPFSPSSLARTSVCSWGMWLWPQLS